LIKIKFFYYRISLRHDDPLSSAVKLGVLGEGRSLTDRRTSGSDARSPNGDVDRNSISIVSQRITGGSQHTLTTQQYLDRTDNADRRRYSCDVIKTLRATEATCSATYKSYCRGDFSRTRWGRVTTRYASFVAFNEAY